MGAGEAGFGEVVVGPVVDAVPNPNPVWPNLAGAAEANAPKPPDGAADPKEDAEEG